jgi:hypothetical protein
VHNKLLKVEGHSDLVRDSSTGAILNTNKEEYEAYLAQVEARKSQEARINKLESDLDEIKGLLKQLINKE